MTSAKHFSALDTALVTEANVDAQVITPPIDDDRPLMTDDAAAYLSLSRAMMCRMRKRGDGPKFVRIGARVVYLKSDLQAWRATRCT